MTTPNPEWLAHLRLYTPSTYGIDLGRVGREMEQAGLVAWVPPAGFAQHTYAITDAGRAYVAQWHLHK